MYFRFGTKKIIEAAGVLLQCGSARRMKYIRLLKLLYIADRESVGETGLPIIGTPLTAMERGPVHSLVYDFITKDDRIDQRALAQWQSCVRTDEAQHEVALVADPGTQSLSDYEVEKLQQVCQKYRSIGRWGVSELTHEFPEWKKHYVEGTSRPIPFEDVIKAVGRGDDLDEIMSEAEELDALHKVLGTAA